MKAPRGLIIPQFESGDKCCVIIASEVMSKKVITICSSATMYKQVLEVEKELKKLGFEVLVPDTARVMEENGDFDVSHYKTWFGKKEDYAKKSSYIKNHFDKIEASGAILVLNLEKNGVAGYIGGNVLVEMGVAFYLGKKIFIYNPPDEKSPLIEEIWGMQPVVLGGNLRKIGF